MKVDRFGQHVGLGDIAGQVRVPGVLSLDISLSTPDAGGVEGVVPFKHQDGRCRSSIGGCWLRMGGGGAAEAPDGDGSDQLRRPCARRRPHTL
jgi:hypothetical protein